MAESKNRNYKELLHRISEYGYVEGGIQHATFVNDVRRHADTVVVALNNADSEGALSELFNSHEEYLMRGAVLLAQFHGAKLLVVHIPESVGKENLALPESEGVEIRFAVGKVNKRAYPGACYCHAVTAIHVAEIEADTYTDGIYTAVNGENLKKYDPETTVGAVLSENGVDTSTVSAVICGYRLCGPAALSGLLYEVYPENGNLQVITDKECVVRAVAQTLKSSYLEGCGKCVFCREGLNQLALAVADIAGGKGKAPQVDIIREISGAMKDGTLCTFGQNRGNIARDLVNAFEAEVKKHIRRKKCTSGVCFSNDTYYVNPAKCSGCGACRGICPAQAIDGLDGFIHMIDDTDCIACGKCLEICPPMAIKVTQSKPPRLPDRLTRVGHFKTF